MRTPRAAGKRHGAGGVAVFIAPSKTCAVDHDGAPVQRMRSNVSLPALTVLGALEASGAETQFLDLSAEGISEQRPLNGRAMVYGVPTSQAVERITVLKPGFVLVTSMFTFEQMMVDELVHAVKTALPDVTVIIGGVHASAKPEWHFEQADPDFVVLGEGEETVAELLRELTRPDPRPETVLGIAFRTNAGVIERTPARAPLAQLDGQWATRTVLVKPDGTPRYTDRLCRKHPVYVAEEIGEDVPTGALYWARGCRMGCDYCPTIEREGKGIRHMGAQNAFELFESLRHTFDVQVFANQAETFGLHPQDRRFLEMVCDYRRTSGDDGFVINNPNAFFVHQFFPPAKDYRFDDEFLDLLAGAGLNTVTIAVETLSPRFNRKVNWNRVCPEQVVELCQTIRQRGLRSDIYMMYGYPGETEEEFNADLKFGEALVEHADLVSWNGLTLLPGTRYYREYVESSLGREQEYREIMRSGYAWHFPLETFNLSQVPTERFREALAPFGRSWL